MLLMHGPAPVENRDFQRRSQKECDGTPNAERTAPLASSSPLPWESRAPTHPIRSTNRPFRQLQVVKRTRYSVALSHWHSLGDFFVHLGMHAELLNELAGILQRAFDYNYSKRRGAASKSAMCMARWEADGEWYRGELLDDEGLVLFVDFGNLAVIRRPDSLHDLPPVALLTDTEALAVRCSLTGLRLLTGVDDVNQLAHPDGRSLAEWFKV